MQKIGRCLLALSVIDNDLKKGYTLDMTTPDPNAKLKAAGSAASACGSLFYMVGCGLPLLLVVLFLLYSCATGYHSN